MALIDDDWWHVRRKLGGSVGGSLQVENTPWPGDYTRVPYLRRRVRVCDRGTTRQREARVRWRYLSKAWQEELSDEERVSWNERAEEGVQGWYDALMQHRHLTGFEFFCGMNARVLESGNALWKDGWTAEWYWGPDVFGVEQLSSTSVRVSFHPELWYDQMLWLGVRGPMSVGRATVVPNVWWERQQRPFGWRTVGYSEAEAASPVDFELPFVWPVGMKVAFLGGYMLTCGGMGDEYGLVELVGA